MQSGDNIEVEITHIAGLGDGAASYQNLPVFVPFSCTGDVLSVIVEEVTRTAIRAQIADIIRPSPQRQLPPCPHFGQCGGCSLQHLSDTTYHQFKQSIAEHTARQLGADNAVVQPLFSAGSASRRRADYKVAVNKGVVTVGFNAARSHATVDAADCRVVVPEIVEEIAHFKALLSTFKKPSLVSAIELTLADNGLDIVIECKNKIKPADAELLQNHLMRDSIVRCGLKVSETAYTIIKSGEPQLHKAGTYIELPFKSFLQATKISEEYMVDAVLSACRDANKVADLYSGCGTFSLPLAQAGHNVVAYEGNDDAVRALFNAAQRSNYAPNVISHCRDLMAKPVTDAELESIDAVVINPPRNGAQPQCRQLAQSDVVDIVMVSCNPATFVRDGKALIAGGYMLDKLIPIDQFTWSAHLELIGVFTRNSQ